MWIEIFRKLICVRFCTTGIVIAAAVQTVSGPFQRCWEWMWEIWDIWSTVMDLHGNHCSLWSFGPGTTEKFPSKWKTMKNSFFISGELRLFISTYFHECRMWGNTRFSLVFSKIQLWRNFAVLFTSPLKLTVVVTEELPCEDRSCFSHCEKQTVIKLATWITHYIVCNYNS